jgi:hypothetical protein
MSTAHATLKFFRKLHLYIGIFISPALLFFAFTGALQTFSLHETTPGSSYKPPAWAVTLGQIHKKQTWVVSVRKTKSAEVPAGDVAKADGDERGGTGPEGREHGGASKSPEIAQPPATSHLPLKIFFLLVSVGLFTSTLTGIYMSYKYQRGAVVITSLLVAGVVLPLVLLPF